MVWRCHGLAGGRTLPSGHNDPRAAAIVRGNQTISPQMSMKMCFIIFITAQDTGLVTGDLIQITSSHPAVTQCGAWRIVKEV